jgi:hypothetical protein
MALVYRTVEDGNADATVAGSLSPKVSETADEFVDGCLAFSAWLRDVHATERIGILNSGKRHQLCERA